MPRAPEYRDWNADETALARKYAVERLAATQGVNDLTIDGNVIASPARKFAVVPSQIKEDGSLHLFYNENGTFPHSGAAEHLLVLEPNSSEMLSVSSEKIKAVMNQAADLPVSVNPKAGGWSHLIMNAAWAKHKLFSPAIPLGTGPDSYAAYRTTNLAVPEQFCHLHVHSMYSFLDGVSTPEGIAKRACENGQPGIALTDHGYGFGLFKFYKACKEHGVKPLLGIEFYVVDDAGRKYTDEKGNSRRFEYHTTVLAANQTGWHHLCKLASLACAEGNYYVPRISFGQLIKYNEGLIVTSGCFKGPVAWHLQHFDTPRPEDIPILDFKGRPIYRRDVDYARAIMRAFKKHLGDRYYVEVQNIDFKRYMDIVPDIIQLAREEGIKIVMTNDCHYEVAEDAALQSVLSRIAGGKDDGNRYSDRGVYFIKQSSEMQGELFTPDMFTNTCEVMERCNVNIPLPGDDDYTFHFPDYHVEADADWAAYQASKEVRVAA